MTNLVDWTIDLQAAGRARVDALWFAPRLSMWPLAARECLVRNPLNGATARLDADTHAFLESCTGAATLSTHEARVIERLRVPPADRPRIRAALQRLCALHLLVLVDDLVDRFGPPVAEDAASALVVVRTADRPALLERLLKSAEAPPDTTGAKRAWHVVDDSRTPEMRAANRAVLDRHAPLQCELHDAKVLVAFGAQLSAAFPDACREIDWLLGGGDIAGATYGRPVNYALLRFAGERLLALDDDAILDARRAPVAGSGVAVASGNDELFAYASDDDLAAACASVNLDPLAEHERWLGLPLANAWPLAARTHGTPEYAIDSGDARHFAADARIAFTQNHAVGDPGSALFPFHVLNLPPASRAHVAAAPLREAAAFGDRHAWRGVPRFRLAPRRLLTFTTLAGIDNRRLLPPTAPAHRNEDLLLGAMAQLLYPASWFADLPFGLPHRRAAPKRWLGPDVTFAQEPLHVLLDLIDADQRGAASHADEPEARLQAIAARLADVGRSNERTVRDLLEAQAIDTASRVLFGIQTQLDDASVPASWKARLQPWLASPALAVEGPALAARLAPVVVVQRLARDYAAALAVWPALWQHATRRA